MLVRPGIYRLGMVSASLVASLLSSAVGRAQVPDQLLGRWQMHQISFVANQTVPPDLLERMNNPAVAELNQELAAGAAQLLVEFQPAGTYQFRVARPGQPAYTETGTYSVKGKTLLAQSPGTENGSSFDNQEMMQLSRRRLIVTFPAGEELPGVLEEVEYRRAP